MNVLFLTTHLNMGGITVYLKTLAREFVRRGHGVYVASAEGDMAEDFRSLGAEHIRVDIKTKSELSPKIYRAVSVLSRYIREKNIDVIHSQTRVTQVLGALLGRIARRTYVSTCHGFFKPRLSRKIFPCWGKGVVAISESVAEHLSKDLGVACGKIKLIHNGLDIGEFSQVTPSLKEEQRKNFNITGFPVIGIIARLSEVKGHDVLIRVMKGLIVKFPKSRLLIVGQGKRETFLKQLVDYLGLKGHVYFYPTLNRTAEMLALMDVFVMPSLQEGLGLSVMEAQASGLPVVASRVGGLPSLIEHEKTGLLVEPNNVEDLTASIVRLLENPLWAKTMGSQARSFIEQKFSSRVMAEKTLEFYQEAMRS